MTIGKRKGIAAKGAGASPGQDSSKKVGGSLSKNDHNYLTRAYGLSGDPGAAPIGNTEATGGDIKYYQDPGSPTGVYKCHIFTGSGTFAVTTVAPHANEIEYLVVGGGGGGGNGTYRLCGGGGAGGLRTNSDQSGSYPDNIPAPRTGAPYPISAGNYTVTIGAGGGAASNGSINPGSDTDFFPTGASYPSPTYIAVAGGGGGAGNPSPPGNGGAGSAGEVGGSGGGVTEGAPGSWTPSNNPAGNQFAPPSPRSGDPAPDQGFEGSYCANGSAGGGGGGSSEKAGSVEPGGNYTNRNKNTAMTYGFGGRGYAAKIEGVLAQYYAGGGGAGAQPSSEHWSRGMGGWGGGGYGMTWPTGERAATSGAANSGGGGGGAVAGTGAGGGSGLVVIRYKWIGNAGGTEFTAKATGGKISVNPDGETVHIFTDHTSTENFIVGGSNLTCKILNVAGGGGAAGYNGGGGGAGCLAYRTGITASSGTTYVVNVGMGGTGGRESTPTLHPSGRTAGQQGVPSWVRLSTPTGSDLISESPGGGYGGANNSNNIGNSNGGAGGSGGGACDGGSQGPANGHDNHPGSVDATSPAPLGYGTAGGPAGGTPNGGAGGGGCGMFPFGHARLGAAAGSGQGGPGGYGAGYTIADYASYIMFAGGGGGGGRDPGSGSNGGEGGGGDGEWSSNPLKGNNGKANTGGGGGAGGYQSPMPSAGAGGDGGSGVVIISYPT